MNRSTLLLASLSSSVIASWGLAGCGVAPVDLAPPDTRAAFDAPPRGVRSGYLVGEVGPALVDASASPLSAYSSMATLRVLGVARQQERAVMLQMTVRTDEVELVPGVNERFTREDLGSLVLLGCVGQEVGVYDEFDSPADDVELVVEPAPGGGPGDVSVQLTGTWRRDAADDGEGGQVASLSFVLVR